MHSRTLLAATLAALAHVSHGFGPWCYTYFGSINATIDLHDVTPETNYDDTVKCPKTWPFPAESGARLTLCPPYGGPASLTSDNPADVALDVKLEYNPVNAALTPRGIRANLRDLYVTDGSHEDPDPDTGAVPVAVKLESNDDDEGPKFSIKGDQTSLFPYKDPTEPDYRWNVLNCEEYHETVAYCSTAPSSKWDEECWGGQTFILTPESDLNFTISFSGSNAVVEMSFAGEVEAKGTSFARMRFEGEHALPAAKGGNLTLWLDGFFPILDSKPEDYFNENIGLDADENGILMFRNISGHEVYFMANESFADGRNPAGELNVGVDTGVDMAWLGVVFLVAIGQVLM